MWVWTLIKGRMHLEVFRHQKSEVALIGEGELNR